MADRGDLWKRLNVGVHLSKEQILSWNLSEGQCISSQRSTAKDLSDLDFFGDAYQTQKQINTPFSSKGADIEERKRSADHHGGSSEDGSPPEKKELFGSDFNEENSESGSDVEGTGISLFTGQSAVKTTSKAKKKKKKKKQKIKSKVELQRQEANAVRNAHNIHVRGADVTDAVTTFEQLAEGYHLPEYLMQNILKAGYTVPTPVQMQVTPLMLQKREVLACAPTGSGKTAAFLIPILKHLQVPKRIGFRAVILSPTRELAQQTHRECIRLSAGSGFKVHILTKASANNFGPTSSQRFDVLVTTPNRLVHLLSQQPVAISLKNVEWLILDEADKLFEEGKNSFKDQISRIYSSCDSPQVKHGMFSATLGSGVEEFVQAHFDSPVRVIIGVTNSATHLIKQELLFVGQEAGKLIAMREIIKKGFSPPVLVFVQSIDRAKELFHELIYDGINVEVIHADRTQAQRDNIVRAFREQKIWVLICTDLMGRGIDFKGVNMVINYDFPTSAISYIHRIGRTGRAGREGRAVTLFTEDDAVNLKSIVNVMRSSGCEVPEWMLQIEKPSKKTKKKLVRKPVKRDSIETITKYDKEKAKKTREMIAASKKKKMAK